MAAAVAETTWIVGLLVLGCLQGIQLDYINTLGGLASMFRKHYYMWLHCIATLEAFNSGIFTGSNLLCSITTPEKD
ncbi:hypothetical protein K7X08_014490 [Anisodus acutangulus]|uniref:Uncharacterized protein n=1 Tax=Anisodus acutangulus TaxID=402998 RepID=A0A9Q1LLY4_9SOLA|nr:hypothetical protein K7X08_014490 [Anisodus acutangulus]